MNRMRERTRSLVHEQIDLTVSQLDLYSQINQIAYTRNIVFNLSHVDGVAILDKNCQLMDKQPINLKFNWDCNLKSPPIYGGI